MRAYAHSVTAIDSKISPGNVEIVYRTDTEEKAEWMLIRCRMRLPRKKMASLYPAAPFIGKLIRFTRGGYFIGISLRKEETQGANPKTIYFLNPDTNLIDCHFITDRGNSA